MTVSGLTLPALSAYDPPLAGEGSLDPMGLGAISERLADRLVPGFRARMQRFRFITAMAVGATVCEGLADEMAADLISTPAICFEWLTIEALVRRLPSGGVPSATPGSQKARNVINRGQRLSAATYLKSPSVFGFTGIYKPLATDAQIVTSELEAGPRCTDITRAWEREQAFDGFTDAVPGSEGGRFRQHLRDQVRQALREGRCTASPQSWLFGHVAKALHPEQPGPQERRALRAVILTSGHETRTELAQLLESAPSTANEAELLKSIRPRCSKALGSIVDAVSAYEELSILINASFRTLCAASYSMGGQPLTPASVNHHETLSLSASELPVRYERAAATMNAIGADGGLEERLGEFAIPRPTDELVSLLLAHHEAVQSAKLPLGKRSWFEQFRGGWIVRNPYGKAEGPQLGEGFVHPVRASALRQYMDETAP
ncbi:hypothetical protein [Mycolicibacterium sp. P1-18]|uniref:hypothetical protein n=1 Tax=Mycolicibacterium sp. P1-18 TaxID=2024615 RepID=UPI0011F2D96A|nr:hypothetical protein [Mycolicibacterium sp. P1-18]